jgi:Putative MetA-pathway of phenol degradation
MPVCFKHALSAISVFFSLQMLHAQDLAPRAYIITPIHSNAVTLTYSFNTGGLIFDGNTPITDAKAKVSVSSFNYSHSTHFFGRTASFLAIVPYGIGKFSGTVLGSETNVYRSGLLASVFRFSVNLKGGPAMDLKEFIKWQQKTLIGASIRVVPPTGQYDPTKLINYGANRWAFKPELGVSQRWHHWLLDTYGAVWFFTTNGEFFSRNQYNPGVTAQSEAPVGAFEGHLSYDVKPRLWASLDGNFWFGGRTSLNGIENFSTMQKNSRVGATFSVPMSRHQSLKFSYSKGAYIRYGGNYQTISLAWQYSWRGRPN